MSDRMRALLVDDELPSLQFLGDCCRADGALDVVGECTSAEQAMDCIQRLNPELVFLDVQMGRMSGLQLVRAIGTQRMPLTIFVTAYDRHAVEAFELNAVDYLLKPFDRDRFGLAVAHARSRWSSAIFQASAEWRDGLRRALQGLHREVLSHESIMVERAGRYRPLPVTEILYVSASGNYIVLHAGSEEYVLRRRLVDAEQMLAHHAFLRIHRSILLNQRAIQEISPNGTGDFLITLINGCTVESGRQYRAVIVDLLRSRT